MKHTTKTALPNHYQKQIIPCTLVVLISLLIWFLGPKLQIANQLPLASPEKRFYLMMLLTLAWALKFIFWDTPTKKIPIPKLSPEIEKKLTQLQGRFAGAVTFLQKTFIKKNGHTANLSNLPWLLLIGPSGAGKTTLLANANINYILTKQFKKETSKIIPPSDTCDWWVTRDKVLLDVPGSYLIATPQSPHSLQQSLWHHLLTLLQGKNKLSGVVITVHLPELMTQRKNPQKSQVVYDLKKRIQELRNTFGKDLPFHLVITKCDLLPGFADFFSDCSSEEAAQLWGITLPETTEKFPEAFTNRFNALIKRLNKQLIWRLHQERNPHARSGIKDFPLHVERLKEALLQFFKALALPDWHLQGVFLTSSTQPIAHSATEANTIGMTHQANTQSLQLISAPALPARAYFIKQLLLHGLMAPVAAHPVVIKNSWQKRLIYAAAITTIITAAFLLGHDFQLGVQQEHLIKNDLAQYQLNIQQGRTTDDSLIEALPLLNGLQQASKHSRHPLSVIEKSLSFYSQKSQQSAQNVYQQTLQTVVVPQIKRYFENYLQNAGNKNPDTVYAILKAYLMLGDAKHRQFDTFMTTLLQLMHHPLDKDTQLSLTNQINTALQSGNTIKLNTDLIAQVRKQLLSLNNQALGMVILKNIDNNNIDSAINLGTAHTNPPIFVSKAVATQIPMMYTAATFGKIMHHEIDRAAIDVVQGNWVLGNASVISANAANIDFLATQLKAQYIANYVDIWESLLANVQLITPQNMSELNNFIGALTGDHSPLLQFLQTIKENTSFSAVTAASPKLQSLSVLLVDASNNQTSHLYQIFVSLKQLHAYLQPIAHAADIDAAAFPVTVARVQNSTQDPITRIYLIAAQSPEPMKSWLTAIATQSWHFMLQASANHIERTWQKEIISVYHNQIVARYPFNQTATQEVSLQTMTHFLGQQGLLSTFYKTNLQPFVNSTDKKWQWRMVNNQKLPFSDEALTQLQQAAQLQQMLFPNGDNKLSVQFALQPIVLDKGANGFTLNINGQEVSYQRNMQHFPRVINWPGNNPTQQTSINFITTNNQLQSNTIKGDWSWFKLVNSTTRSMTARRELILDFSVNGHTAKYLLFTQGHINPFLPSNFTRFQLPERLLPV